MLRGRLRTLAPVLLMLALSAATLGAQRGGAAWLLRSLAPPGGERGTGPSGATDVQQSRPDILDAPVLPGSVMKAVTLVAALESGVITPSTSRLCRRVVNIDGVRYTCSHPDMKRPLTAAEALAHSCNDFFVSLAGRLSRTSVNDVRARLGLPPIAPQANLAAALVGLDGPRMAPRAVLDMMTRLVGADPGHPVTMAAATRRVLLDGLRGAASYGSASELGDRGIVAMAKTGTAPMPGGGVLGLTVAFVPAHEPRQAAVVVAPGAAGRDATSLAGDLLAAGDVSLRVGVTGSNGRVRVETVRMDDYVARVLAGEGEPRAADAAQQSLAIAIRTFALANRNRHARDGYDMCDTTHCQVLRAPTASSTRAAAATSGRVLVRQGKPAEIFYSASCGGHPELASEVWPGAIDYGGAAGREDHACEGEPAWTSEMTAREVESALRAAGLRGDRLRELRVVERNASGRVARLRADGFTPAEVSGQDFRMAVGRVIGWQRLKSLLFEMRRTASGYAFAGQGFGHGVGLCVIGAGRRAVAGETADEILRFYYPGLTIDQFHPADTAAAAVRTVPPPAARPAPAADVQVALPAAEESDRALVTQIVRRGRDDIAARAGVAAPPVIRITVHPTVESFNRATGHPWWVSGAASRDGIDLLSLTVLKQRGPLERTIRHEVAHLLVDDVLRDRPLWVREGAAAYFADPAGPPGAAAAGRRDAARCPSDAELSRSVSAAMLRDAYARAESCFRRQLAAGRSWRDVK